MYGLFFEDISYGADGGLYAELIQNRNFEELLHRGSNGSETAVLRPLYKWHAVDGAITAVTKKADGNVVEINKAAKRVHMTEHISRLTAANGHMNCLKMIMKTRHI